MKARRETQALLAAFLLLGTSCGTMKEERSKPGPEGPLREGTNSPRVSIDDLPGLARLRHMFSTMGTGQEDPERKEVTAAVRHEGQVTVLGVYPVRAPEPCYLIELRITGTSAPFDIGAITQPQAGVHRSRWQVPWREVLLDADGTRILAGDAEIKRHPAFKQGCVRLAFFLHYADLQRPLETPFGNVALTAPTRKPRRLRAVRYESPD